MNVISRAPEQFEGSWLDLYRKHIEPNLPQTDVVGQFHEWLVKYCQDPASVFYVRAVRGAERRKIYSTCDGTQIAPTDNSPAWVVHASLMERRLSNYQDFMEFMALMPTHFFDIAKVAKHTANWCGWYVAHIYQAKNGDTNFRGWNRNEAARRFLCSVHPCNFFLVPGVRNKRGEDPKVIAFMAAQYAIRYGTIWTEFIAQIGATQLLGESSFGLETVRVDSPEARAVKKIGPFLPGSSSVGEDVTVSYDSTRLDFRRNRIEPLAEHEQFEVRTPMGIYRFTKRDFYSEFPNIVRSASYREGGRYHGERLHLKACRFRVVD